MMLHSVKSGLRAIAVIIPCLIFLLGSASAKTVVSGTISANQTWDAAGSPYEVSDAWVDAGVTLTVSPGTLVQFRDYATFHVHGRIVATGTETQKVTFTSISGVKEGGPWRAIRLTNADGAGNGLPSSSFNHCILEGGGYWYDTMLEVKGGAMVSVDQCVFRDSTADGIKFYDKSGGPITNTTFADNAGYGLWLRGSSPAIQGCSFRGNGNAGRLESGSGLGSFPAFVNTTFEGDDKVHIGSNMDSGGTLTAAPYYLDGERWSAAEATITIQGGSTFAMADYSGWTVLGNLIAEGTAGAPIAFSRAGGAAAAPWRALRLTNNEGNGNAPPSTLSYCTFDGGGYWFNTLLEVWGGAPVSLNYCTFRNSTTDGVKFYENSGGPITNTRFEKNTGYGLWLRGSSPAVDAGTFTGNGNAGRLESGAGKGSFPAFTNTTFTNTGFFHIASNIDSGGTLTAAPYFIDGERFCAAGATITIQGGATFAVADYSGLTVKGNLIADGTQAAPIIFSRAGGAPWRALRLTNNDGTGQASSSRLSWCTLDGGGYWYNTNLEVAGGAPISLDHCTFRNSTHDGVKFFANSGGPITNSSFVDNAGYGLWLRGSSPAVQGCSFRGNGNAGRLESGSGLGSFPAFVNTTFEGDDKVHIASNMDSGGTLTAAPYYLDGERSSAAGATISVQAGATFAMADYSGWTVLGNLLAEGTASAPISFSRAGGAAGAPWRAVRLTNNEGNGTALPSRLSYCTMDGGGYWYNTLLEVWGGAPASLDHCNFRNSTVDGVRFFDKSGGAIANCSFEDVAQYGLRLQSTSPSISNSTFQRCGYQAVLLLGTAANGSSFPAFSNNTFGPDDYVQIGSNLNSSGYLSNPGQAYIVNGERAIEAAANVSIAPGTTVLFTDYSGWVIDGSLDASGSGDRPITFTSDDSVKGRNQWRGLVFTGNRTKASQLKYCTVEAGGYWYGTLVEVSGAPRVSVDQCTLRTCQGDGIQILQGTDVPVTLTSISDCSDQGIYIDRASPSIKGCDLHGNAGSGIYTANATAYLADCLLRDNGNAGLRAVGGSVPSASNCFIAGNTAYGVRNETAQNLPAQNNWWGDPTGPYHPVSNPNGKGDKVTDKVLYDPYRVFASGIPQEVQATLSNGVAVSGLFPQGVTGYYYAIDVPAGQNLTLMLDDLNNQGVTQVYLSRNGFPTPGSYQVRHETTGADQRLFVSAAGPGRWYALVFQFTAETSSAFTIRADMAEISLFDVAPSRHSNTVPFTMTLNGAGFTAGSKVELVSGAAVYAALGTGADSFTRITADFAAHVLPAGTYDVRVTVPGKAPATLARAFEALEGGRAKLVTDIIVPAAVGYHQLATLYVEYANKGDAAMPAPLLIVTGIQNGQKRALLTLDKSRLVQGFWTSAIPEGFSNSVQILAGGATPGVLQPGESGRIPVYYAGWQQPWNFSYPPIDFGISALEGADPRPVDWATLKASLHTGGLAPEALNVIWENYRTAIGSTVGDFVRMLGANAAYLARLGYTVQDVDMLNQFEFLQAEGIAPLPSVASAVDYSLQASGMPLEFKRFFPANLSRRFREGNLGRGWIHSWDISSGTLEDGTIIVRFRGEHRVFQPDARGGYFAAPNDTSRLVAGGSGVNYVLKNGDGLSYSFKDGKLISVADGKGNTISVTHTAGKLSRLVHSSGPSLDLSYDNAGHLSSITDHRQRRTTFTYAGGGGLLGTVTDPYARVTNYTQNGGSGASSYALTSLAMPDGSRRNFTYDQNGRLAATNLTGGLENIGFAYDANGGVTMTDGLGKVSKTFYDHRGIASRFTDSHGASITQIYGERMNLLSESDETGAEKSYSYDNQGRLTRILGKLGGGTKVGYDGSGRVASVTDETGRTTQVGYDAAGNLNAVAYADGTARSFTHDPVGNVSSFVNARGARVQLNHDASGRLTSKVYPNGDTHTYTYDSRGRLASTQDPSGTSSFTYNANDQLTRVTYPGNASLTYNYDSAGRRVSMTDHQGNLKRYEYDPAGRVSRVADGVGKTIVGYEYDAAGNVARKTNPDGSSATYEYHQSGQVSRETRFDATGNQAGVGTIAYNASGQPISIQTATQTKTYAWDANGQIQSQTTSPAGGATSQTDTFAYDASGRLTRVVRNGVPESYTITARGDYASAGNVSFQHDADGNVTGATSPAGTSTYSYDSENRLVAASSPAGNWAQTIGATGLTTAIVEGNQTYTLLNDPLSPVTFSSMINQAGQHVVDSVYGADFTVSTEPFAYSPVSQPGLISQWEHQTYPLSPFGMPLLTTVGEIGKVALKAGEHPFAQSLPGFAADLITNTWTGIGSGLLGAGIGTVEILSGGRDIVTTLPWLQTQVKLGSAINALGYLAGTIETGQGIYNGDGNKISHGLGSIAATGIGTFLSGAGASALFYGYGGPIGIGIGVAAVAIDFAGRDGGLMEDFWIWWDDLDVTEAGHRSKPSASMDPNEKLGPSGYGDANYVGPGSLLPYRIDFENDKAALAPAQVVMVSDPLSDKLDWSTFELTEAGFGDHLIPVYGSTRSLNVVETMSYNGKSLAVAIDINLNPVTGVITAIFSTSDTTTGLPPEVQYGFLPPEDGTGRGQGHFAYTIRAKEALPTGTEIRNVAGITFDFSTVIKTNQVDPHDPSKGTDPNKEALVTIDATRPTSSVQALPANSPSTFTVRWSGNDGTGSGLGRYSVFVQDGTGGFLPWLENTTSTSASFSGANNHTYRFYSIARDNAGNEEPAKVAAEAFTTVAGGTDPFQNWLPQYFTNAEIQAGILTARTADPDGDGNPNSKEFAFVTNPRVPDGSRIVAGYAGGVFTLEYWRRTAGISYTVQSSTSLGNWLSVPNPNESVLATEGDTQRVRVSIPSPSRASFFRVAAD